MLIPRFRPIDLAYALLFGIALRSIAVLAEALAAGGFRLPGLVLIDGQLEAGDWITWVIAPIVLAPFIEEWIFRGVLQPLTAYSLKRFGIPHRSALALAVVVVAALFAAGHLLLNPGGAPWVTGVTTFLVGLACGSLSAFTGRLGPAIGTHAVFNATGVALLLAGTFG